MDAPRLSGCERALVRGNQGDRAQRAAHATKHAQPEFEVWAIISGCRKMSARLSQCEWAEEGKVRNVFIPSFFSLQSKPNARRRTSPCHAMHCRRGGRVTMHSPGQTATKARGQNTGHDRVARCHTCYLDDRVHAEQRQRARSSLCLLRRHRWCHCRRDIPGIWRFGLLRRGAQTHEKKVGQQQIAVAAEGRTVLVRRTDY